MLLVSMSLSINSSLYKPKKEGKGGEEQEKICHVRTFDFSHIFLKLHKTFLFYRYLKC